MKTIKVLKIAGKWYLYVVGLFFVLMALDCFGSIGCPDCDSIWEQLLCFIISIIPGAIIVAINYFLRKKENILGVILVILAIVAFVFFKFYLEFLEKIPTFLIVSFLPFLIGILFFFTYEKEVDQ